ncbi:MAG: HAMP domain-containing protein, partial [Ferrovibrionaceae bacterium]
MSISIANRILIGFVILIALTVLLGSYALNQIGVVRDAANTIVTRDLDIMRQLDAIRDGERAMREARQDIVYGYLMRQLGRGQASPEDAIAQWRRRAAAAEALVTEASGTVNGYRAAAVSPDRIEAWRRIGQRIGEIGLDIRQMREQTDRQIAAIAANDIAATETAENGVSQIEDIFGTHLAGAREAVNGGIVAGQRRADEIYDDSRLSIWGALAMAAVVAIVISTAIRLSITRPLNALMGFVERVGQGDLAGQVAATGRDEFGRLGATLNGMVAGLRQLARQSREATENLNAAAAEIRASTQEQSASVEEQFAA